MENKMVENISIKNIKWERIEIEDDEIWLLSKPISTVQYNSIKILLSYLIEPLTAQNSKGEIGFWDRNMFSVTIRIKDNYDVTDDFTFDDFLTNTEKFFDFKKKNKIKLIHKKITINKWKTK